MSDAIVVLNAGSSSIKFSVFLAGDGDLAERLRGQIEGIYTAPRFAAKDASGAVLAEKAWGEGTQLGHDGALDHLLGFLKGQLDGHRLIGVGHRVVHGGAEYSQPVRVDAALLDRLAAFIPLAPLHHPHNLGPIRHLAARSRSRHDRCERRDRGLRLTADDVEQAYHEHGINTFLFHFLMRPMVEGLRRLIRAGHRDDLVLIAEAGIPTGGFVRRAWERHARAVGTEVIAVFLLGWIRARWYVTGHTWPAMERLRATGAVRAIGFSSHDRPLAASLARDLRPDVLMLRYNAAHRGAETEVFATLPERRPRIIAYTATRWGMLLQPLPEQGFPAGMTAGECYRFALSHPSVDVALCAARSAEELRADVAAVREGPSSPCTAW